MGQIRILIADDNASVRASTRLILEQEKDFVVIAEAADGEEAVRLTDISKPNVIIMDVAMPNQDGIEATRQIKASYPSTNIIVLSVYNDSEFIRSSLEAGASGYLLKYIRGRELVEAIRAVHAGESIVSTALAYNVQD